MCVGGIPRAPTCNTTRCTSDGWTFFPVAQGTACDDSTGQAGVCDGGLIEPPNEPVELGQCQAYIKGTIVPKYQIVNVMYAPPGTQGDVDYQAGSTLGTTTATSSTWVNSVSLTMTTDATFGPFAAGDLSMSIGTTSTNSDSSSFDVKEVTTADVNINRDAGDGLNHDFDQIYFPMNGQFNVTINPLNTDEIITELVLRPGEIEPRVQFLTAGQLRGTQPIASGVASDLAKYGIVSSDFPQILSADPFFVAGADFTRFVPIAAFTYDPVTSPTQTPTVTSFSLSTTSTSVATQSSSQQFSVGLTLGGSGSFLDLVKVKLKLQDTFSYTLSNSFSRTNANSVSAKVNIPRPSFGYQGPVEGTIYMDTIYNTLMFELN